jgi:hypothetical protein
VTPILLDRAVAGELKAADAPGPRRATSAGGAEARPADHRRIIRFRRTVLLTLVALLMGTAVARSAQDPAVAIPRASDGRIVPEAPSAPPTGAGVVADPLGAAAAPPAPAPVATATPSPSATAGPVASSGAVSAGEIEEGATEPSGAPGDVVEAVQQSALGTTHPVALNTAQAPALGRPVRYSVEVEDGITANEKEFADTVRTVLADARGWASADGVGFVPVPPADVQAGAAVDVRITLATPQLTARLCAPLNTTISEVSCWNGGRAVINLFRWARGSTTFGADLAGYRAYLINHEVGHGLGHRHQQCPAPGQPAPIMVQQTKSLEGCTAWPWPTRP